jgi:hypothetical protein
MLWLVLLVVGCGRPAPVPGDGGADSLATAAGVDPASAAREEAYRRAWNAVDTSRIWFERTRLVDLTGDEVNDSLVLRARGSRPDSLLIRLYGVVNGQVVRIEGWHSDYELIDPPFPVDTNPEVVASFVLTNLDTTMARFSVERRMVEAKEFDQYEQECTVDPVPCIRQALGPDSALAVAVTKDLLGAPRVVITYSFGYESTISKVWSPVARRFLLVWGCC